MFVETIADSSHSVSARADRCWDIRATLKYNRDNLGMLMINLQLMRDTKTYFIEGKCSQPNRGDKLKDQAHGPEMSLAAIFLDH